MINLYWLIKDGDISTEYIGKYIGIKYYYYLYFYI